MYFRAGRPAFARPYVGVHRNTSLMSSSLLLQQCFACLVRLTWIVFEMGGRWPYSWCLVGCYLRTFSILLATFLCNCRLTYIYIYISLCVLEVWLLLYILFPGLYNKTHFSYYIMRHLYLYIYIYIYIYICISLNIIDILCLHIFFWIRSNSRITFIVFWANWFMYCP